MKSLFVAVCVSIFVSTFGQVFPGNCNPCEPGRVKVFGRAFLCECPAHYSGIACQTYNNPCSPNPCNNQGQCSVVGDSYHCACVHPWSGPTCDTYTAPTGCLGPADCRGKENGAYQLCSTCDHYAVCVGGEQYRIPCQNVKVWDNNAKRCLTTSSTCPK